LKDLTNTRSFPILGGRPTIARIAWPVVVHTDRALRERIRPTLHEYESGPAGHSLSEAGLAQLLARDGIFIGIAGMDSAPIHDSLNRYLPTIEKQILYRRHLRV